MKNKLFLFILSFTIKSGFCSVGDSSPYFRQCTYDCITENCTDNGSQYKRSNLEIFFYTITFWKCDHECEYLCMWRTVHLYQERQDDIPQFYGKWPFIKFLAMQEPASTVFSLLNLYAHVKMVKKLKQNVRPDSPYLWMWYIHGVVCSHAWIWSAIFHTRDTELTEFMDYSCAYSMVLYSFYTMMMRYLVNAPKIILVILTTLCLSFYANHTAYLYTGRFDYRYNMEVNILTGVLGVIGWLVFAVLNRKWTHTRKIAIYATVVAITTLLELIDAPPILWIFDCHALWHLSTIPAVYIVYSFAIDDCKYLKKEIELRRKESL